MLQVFPVVSSLKEYCRVSSRQAYISLGATMSVDEQAADSGLDREKWEIERAFREREVAVKEADLDLKRRQQEIDFSKAEAENKLRERELSAKERELELKRKESEAAGWRSPLVVAIFAATLAAAGSAAVAVVNGWEERNLERQKSEEPESSK